MEVLSSIVLLSMVEESMSMEDLLLLTMLRSMIIKQPSAVVAYATITMQLPRTALILKVT
jgi:hypothetical protein